MASEAPAVSPAPTAETATEGRPEIKATVVDLRLTDVASTYPNPTFVLILDNAFTPEECEEFVKLAVRSKGGDDAEFPWEPAMTNTGPKSGQAVCLEERKCGRIMVDDQALADRMLERVRPWLEDVESLGGEKAVRRLKDFTTLEMEIKKEEEGEMLKKGRDQDWVHIIGSKGLKGRKWKLSRLNERLRFLRYGEGHYFNEHCDAQYSTNPRARPEERSFITFHLYLSNDRNLVGGTTRIHALNRKDWVDVEPKQGRVLLFQQRFILHSGEEVKRGWKYMLRTDLMYKEVMEKEEEKVAGKEGR